MIVSDCCGAEAGEFLDIEICPDCREHGEFVESEEGGESEEKDQMKQGPTRKYVVSKNNPFYPCVEYFDTIEEAMAKMDEWYMQEHDEDGCHESQITVSQIISSKDMKTFC